jgi:hypothetical protein
MWSLVRTRMRMFPYPVSRMTSSRFFQSNRMLFAIQANVRTVLGAKPITTPGKKVALVVVRFFFDIVLRSHSLTL